MGIWGGLVTRVYTYAGEEMQWAWKRRGSDEGGGGTNVGHTVCGPQSQEIQAICFKPLFNIVSFI